MHKEVPVTLLPIATNDQILVNKTCQAGPPTKYFWADVTDVSAPSLDSRCLILLLYGLSPSAFITVSGAFPIIVFFQLQNHFNSLFFPMKAADYLPNVSI